jgi:hypothetical protein
LSNVRRQTAGPVIRLVEFEALKPFNPGVGSCRPWQTFQETATTQWQKN